MKKQKARLPRNPAAAALALPQYRRRVTKVRKAYIRKTKHKQEYSTWWGVRWA